MESAFLIIITLLAMYYLYTKIFKKKDCDGECGCGKK